MKKAKFLVFPIIAAASLVAGCSSAPVNQAPELRGITDVSCLVNATVDLLDGVSALDTEDGDITPDLKITVTPSVAVENGYARFTEAGDYEIVYEIYDSGGKMARTTAYANVVEREVYSSDFLTGGFYAEVSGGAKISSDGLTGNVYKLATCGAEIAEDVKLIKNYPMICGQNYTFTYKFVSSAAGKIRIAADGVEIDEKNIAEGANELTFTHKLPERQTAGGEIATDSVNIELWFGGVAESLVLELSGAKVNFYQPESDYSDLVTDFNFGGKIHDRFDGTAGTVETVDGGAGAKVEISSASSDMWRGGMFVDTGIALNAGGTYKISFDTFAENDSPFEVCIQRKQWGPDEFITTLTNPAKDGVNELEISINGENSGSLWLYVQSGAHENAITVSNLKVQVKAGGDREENYFVSGFTSNHGGGGLGEVKTENGNIIYEIKSFGSDWGNNEIGSPVFNLSGAAENFVVTFKAKATKNLNCVFAATASGAWDTFAWEIVKLSTVESVYTIKCNPKSLEGEYKFVWQFGNSANTGAGATVEISDVKICLKSDLEK